jgi:plastocyanin
MAHRLQRWIGLAAAGALCAVALVPMPALAAQGPKWNIAVGAERKDAGLQANGFFTNNITIHAGDQVNWNRTVGEIHTVTFAPVGPPFSVTGPPDTGQIVLGPGFFPAGGSSYTGGYANSGIFGVSAVSDTYSLTFPNTGVYPYVCLIHPGMDGTVNVVSPNTALPATQADYDRASRPQQSKLFGLASSLLGQGTAAAAPKNVTAGAGELVTGVGAVADLRFAPDKRVVHVGDTVTWTNRDPQTPHTITFGPENFPNAFAAYAPVNASGGHATVSDNTTLVNSGFIANDQVVFPGSPNTFSATFTVPGTYPYVCALHDGQGMVGSITVLR